MRRLICAVTAALVALGVVVGAAFAKQAGPSSSKTVTVSYFTFSAAPDHLNTLKALIGIFEKKHPNIQISFQTAPYSDYFTKLQTQIAGGQAPDTFELDYGTFYGYATSGALLNLSKVAKTDPTFNAGIFYPKAYSAFAVGKTQFGLPESYSDVLLFYNKDLFKAAGRRLPHRQVDLERRDGCGQEAHQRLEGRLGRLPADPVLRVLQGAGTERRLLLQREEDEGDVRQPGGHRRARLAAEQARHGHADAGAAGRACRRRNVQARQARDVAQRHLAVLRDEGRTVPVGTSSSSLPAR